MPARLVVLVSGTGTTLQALLDAAADPAWGGEVVAVGADRPDAGGLQRARDRDVVTFVVPPAAYPDRADWDGSLADAIGWHRPDLVVCAGFMRLVGPAVLDRFTLVNTHPALLPAFPGTHALRDALAYGVKVTGVTVHLVDAGVDTGPVIAQRPVDVCPDDTEDSLRERVQAVERPLYVDVVGRMARHGWTRTGRKVDVA